MTINAHFIGQVLVPDQPLDLAEGEAVEVEIRRRDRSSFDAAGILSRLPLIELAPGDAEAINRDSEFNILES